MARELVSFVLVPKLQLGHALVLEAPASPSQVSMKDVQTFAEETCPRTPPPCEAELRSHGHSQAGASSVRHGK